MEFFNILQLFFDAVFLFGVLFLFHYTVHHSRKKKEESEIIKNVQVQEMKENLQELLLTLKQLGKEVSDNIQEQVRTAEDKSEEFKKLLQKLQKDLAKVQRLSDQVGEEKARLEQKFNVIRSGRERMPAAPEAAEQSEAAKEPPAKALGPVKVPGAVGFSSALVKEVYRLSDAKMGVNEIIRKTRLSRAEVQLILNLRANRFTTPN